MAKVFIATIKVAVKAEACGDQSGACDWFSGLLSENPDVIDWAYRNPQSDPHEYNLPENYQEGDLDDFAGPPAGTCRKCGTQLKNGRCQDVTCPYSDRGQHETYTEG